jgi:hypothetical protein
MKPGTDTTVTARNISRAVVSRLTERAEPFPSDEFIVPSLFRVYLRESDDRRLEPLKNEMRRSICGALDSKLEQLNESLLSRARGRKYRRLQEFWQLDFYVDTEEKAQEGGFWIWSDFPELDSKRDVHGAHTVRATVDAFGTTRNDSLFPRPAREELCAHFRFEDKLGRRVYAMAANRTGENPVKIGRGGDGKWVDIEIVTESTEISREHAAVRRNASSGVFEILDTSKFGTTVNRRECSQNWEPLPPVSRIVLAGTIILDFEATQKD